MKSKILVTIFIAVIALIVGCDSLWRVSETSSITFTIDTSDFQGVKTPQNSRNGISSIDSDMSNVTVSIHNADDDSVIASKTENIDDDGIAEIEFTNLAIVGKTVYAKVLLIKDGVATEGVSEIKRMRSGSNTLTIKNFGEVQVVAPKISMTSIEATPTDSPIGNKTVTLTSTTPDAQIYYTIDGSDPETNGIPYNDTPFNLLLGSEEIEIQVIAKKDGYENSNVTSETYEKLLSFTYNASSDSYSVGHWDYFYEGDIIIPATHDNGIDGEWPVTSISDNISNNFAHNKMRNVYISKGLTTIGSTAFAACENLESVSIPASVTTIGEGAFTMNPKLTDFILESHTHFSKIHDNQNIAEGLFHIDTGTFIAVAGGDPNGHYIFNLNLSIKHIGLNAFRGNNYVEIIGIPVTIETIGSFAFKDCSSLREFSVLQVNDNYQSVDGVLYTNGGTELFIYPQAKEGSSFAIPETVTSLSTDAFYGCAKIINIIIPASLTNLSNLNISPLEKIGSIIIPNTVLEVNNYGMPKTLYVEQGGNKFAYTGTSSVVWGCTIDRDAEPYLVSVTNVEIVDDGYSAIELQAPYRTGYTFAGWSTNQHATSADSGMETADSLRSVNNSSDTYYAVWTYTP